MAIEERATGLQMQHENDNLKAEIRDLNEKLETLKGWNRNELNVALIHPFDVFFYHFFFFSVRRSQDKDKLKEADKMRLQLDQLLEFKRAILESQSLLQKELQRVKHEAKESLAEQQSKLSESDEYQEMLEMATLDKEMAEEKVFLSSIMILLLINMHQVRFTSILVVLTQVLICRLKVYNWR